MTMMLQCCYTVVTPFEPMRIGEYDMTTITQAQIAAAAVFVLGVLAQFLGVSFPVGASIGLMAAIIALAILHFFDKPGAFTPSEEEIAAIAEQILAAYIAFLENGRTQ